MGGSSSKSAVSSLSTTISNIAMSTVQECQISAEQVQTVNVVNTGFKLWGNYTLQQQTDIRSDCFNDIRKQTDMQNKIIDAISQATSADSVALLGAFGTSTADASANLSTIVRNTVTMSNIQRSYNAIRQTQTVNFINSGVTLIETPTLTQGANLFAAATLKEIDSAGIFTRIEKHIDQTTTATQKNPLDFIAGIINSAGGVVTTSVFLFILLIAAGIFGFYLVTRGGDSSTTAAPDHTAAPPSQQ